MNADVMCDHASLSRQHAQLAWHRQRRAWCTLDLGSAHHTFIDDIPLRKVPPCWACLTSQPVQCCFLQVSSVCLFSHHRLSMQGTPEELYPGSKLRFGASTRVYTLQPPQALERKRGRQGLPGTPPDKRVRFSGGLESIVGYSDGRQE